MSRAPPCTVLVMVSYCAAARTSLPLRNMSIRTIPGTKNSSRSSSLPSEDLLNVIQGTALPLPSENLLQTRWCCATSEDIGSMMVADCQSSTAWSGPSTALRSIVYFSRPLSCPWGYSPTKLKPLDDDGIPLELMVRLYADNYCLTRDANGRDIINTCRPDPLLLCANQTCVSKCCALTEVFDGTSSRCTATNQTMAPILEFHSTDGELADSNPQGVRVLTGWPVCEGFHEQLPDSYSLLPSGEIFVHDAALKAHVNTYCLEQMTGRDKDPLKMAYICNEALSAPQRGSLELLLPLYSACLVASCLCLTLTLVCHTLVPALRDMQGLCFMAHVSALLVAVGTLLTINLLDENKIAYAACAAAGLILHTSFLAAFLWLNVMCFDIWRVIRCTVRGRALQSILDGDHCRFWVYSGYAWGVALGMGVVTGVVQFAVPHTKEYSHVLRPGIGHGACVINGRRERTAYMYWLVAVLFLTNLTMLGTTMVSLYRAGSAFKCLGGKTDNRVFNRHHLDAFWHRFLLFALMALCWVFELLGFLIPDPPEAWLLADFLNALQGFFVFIIFVLSQKKRQMVLEGLRGTWFQTQQVVRRFSRSEDTKVSILQYSDLKKDGKSQLYTENK